MGGKRNSGEDFGTAERKKSSADDSAPAAAETGELDSTRIAAGFQNYPTRMGKSDPNKDAGMPLEQEKLENEREKKALAYFHGCFS